MESCVQVLHSNYEECRSVIYNALIFLINSLGICVFGEFEFWSCSIEAVALVGLILIGLIIDPQHDRIGRRYWRAPYGPLREYLLG